MGTATATVEVLTAEVHVLKVGSRQVTMSVYRQLDEVRWADVEPFGRVRDKDYDPDYVQVIGSHKDTGALVRTKRPLYPPVRGILADDLFGRCGSMQRHGLVGQVAARWEGIEWDVYLRDPIPCGLTTWECRKREEWFFDRGGEHWGPQFTFSGLAEKVFVVGGQIVGHDLIHQRRSDSFDVLTSRITRRNNDWVLRRDDALSWARMPLIVLAGLR